MLSAGQDVYVQGPAVGANLRKVGTLADYECDALPETCWPGATIETAQRLDGAWIGRHGPAQPRLSHPKCAGLDGALAAVEWTDISAAARGLQHRSGRGRHQRLGQQLRTASARCG